MKLIIILVMTFSLPGWIAGAAAARSTHEWGMGRYLGNYPQQYDAGFDRRSGGKSYRDRASIPRAHKPPPGKCLIWFLSRLPAC
jgi:hypothetical protein